MQLPWNDADVALLWVDVSVRDNLYHTLDRRSTCQIVCDSDNVVYRGVCV